MHYYQFNIGDYYSHTLHLDTLEDIAYRRMLDYCYLHEKSLPESINEIAKLIRMPTECERIANVLREFFYLENGEYIHDRVISEIVSFHEKSTKAQASAKARWDKNKNKNKKLPVKIKCDANALRTDCEGNAIQETRNTKQETRNNIIIPSGINLNAWSEWTAYRKSKKKAVSKIAADKQFQILLKYPEHIQKRIIDNSITNDYQGLFEPKVKYENSKPSFIEPKDTSAAGRVRENVRRAREDRNAMANDGQYVWPQVD